MWRLRVSACGLVLLASCVSAPVPEPAPEPPRLAARPKASHVESAPAAEMTAAAKSPACAAPHIELPELLASGIDVAVPPVVDPDGALHGFHERVAEVLRGAGKRPVRIGVFGDSNMTMDWITGEMRRVLQEKYGDAGHGYLAFGRPWRWYRHMDVRTGYLELDWTPFAVSTHPSRDAAYGFAGIAARSEREGAAIWIATAEDSAPVGKHASRFDLYYLKKPKAGSFEVRADGEVVARVSADSSRFEAGFHAFELPDAPHKIEVVSTSRRSVTLFGLTLEREAPSFVVDSLGVGAASGPVLLRQKADVMRAALARRGYDLVVLLLGSNQVWPVKYEEWMGELIARFREAIPGVGILIMTPVDQVTSVKATRSVPDLRLVARQNESIARKQRCAFWDFRGAMGGEASMVRFIGAGMGSADGIHLTQKGARYMARRALHALFGDYERYVGAHPGAGCGTP